MKLRMPVLMIALVGLSACQTPGEPPPSESCPGYAEAGSIRALEALKVRYIDQPEVSVVEMRCVQRSDLLRIDVELRNDRAREQRVAYRFDWFESNGMSIDTEEAWKPLLLYPDEVKTIRTVSPSESAQDFKLVIKR